LDQNRSRWPRARDRFGVLDARLEIEIFRRRRTCTICDFVNAIDKLPALPASAAIASMQPMRAQEQREYIGSSLFSCTGE
jgi:hypothetical protein